MKIEIPGALATTYAAYEAALFSNDMLAITGFFLPGGETIRYGFAELQKGHDEIARHNARQPEIDRRFTAHDLEAQQLAPGVVVLTTTFSRSADGATGRQSQVWVETPGGWRIAHAHISLAPLNRSGLAEAG